MNRTSLLITTLLLAAAALLAGCNEAEQMSRAEAALADYRDMPAEEREPALRTLAEGGTPDAVYGWYGLGNLYYERSGEENVPPGANSLTGISALLDSAVVCYEKAIAADSTLVEGWVNMGLIWDDISDGRTPQARAALTNAQEAYLKAIELAPEDEKARCNLGSLYFRRHQYPEAIEQFQAVLDNDPGSALAHYNMAIMFAESRMYREALVEWEAAVESDPDGDIGERSRENIQVIEQLMASEIPEELTTGHDGHGH